MKRITPNPEKWFCMVPQYVLVNQTADGSQVYEFASRIVALVKNVVVLKGGMGREATASRRRTIEVDSRR